MSVRKRKWTTRSGEDREAWIVDYTDQQGERHIETFDRKKDADARHAEVTVDVKAGVHVAPSKSVTVNEAGEPWIEGNEAELERTTVDLQPASKVSPAPVQRARKLTDLTTDRCSVLRHSSARRPLRFMVRKVLSASARSWPTPRCATTSAATRCRIFDGRSRRARPTRKRKKDKAGGGRDIPSPAEVAAIMAHGEDRWRPLLVRRPLPACELPSFVGCGGRM